MGTPVRIGHLSDLHVADRARYPRHGLGPEQCDRYLLPLAEALLAALAEAAVDHLVVTGDLTLSGEASELRRAAAVLRPWARAGRLTVVPGNHDVWSRASAEESRFLRHVGPDGRGHAPRDVWPWRVALSPEVVLVALDSAPHGDDPQHTPGRLGAAQLEATRRIVAEDSAAGRAVVIALHHPVVLPRERVPSDVWVARTALADAPELVRLVAELPVSAVLHGHRHVPFRLDLPGVHGRTPVLCAGSATRDHDEPARRPRALVCAFDADGLRSVEALIAPRPRGQATFLACGRGRG